MLVPHGVSKTGSKVRSFCFQVERQTIQWLEVDLQSTVSNSTQIAFHYVCHTLQMQESDFCTQWGLKTWWNSIWVESKTVVCWKSTSKHPLRSISDYVLFREQHFRQSAKMPRCIFCRGKWKMKAFLTLVKLFIIFDSLFLCIPFATIFHSVHFKKRTVQVLFWDIGSAITHHIGYKTAKI